MNTKEQFQPPPNLPPGDTLLSRFLFGARIWLDLSVCSVLSGLVPWLEKRSGTLLEVGCGAQPYRKFVPSICKYQGLDWQGSEQVFKYKINDVIYYDGINFPFPAESFDSIMHTEVLEHTQDPELFLYECARVLRTEGNMFFSVPFQARYHYIPFDYWRFTPAGLDLLLRRCGFSRWTISPRGSDISVAALKGISLGYRGWGATFSANY